MCRRSPHHCCCNTPATTSASTKASPPTKQHSRPTTRCTRFTCTTVNSTASTTTQHRVMTKRPRNWRGRARSSSSTNTCGNDQICDMTRGLNIVLAFAFVIASLSCQNEAQVVKSDGVPTSQATTTKVHLPQPWLGKFESNYITQIEVRKVPNSSDEFFFGALPYGDRDYAHEVDKKLQKPQYGKNIFALDRIYKILQDLSCK